MRRGDCVVSGATVAAIKILNVDMTGEALRAGIEKNLARQDQPELSAIHLVRDLSDFHRGDAALRYRLSRSAAFKVTRRRALVWRTPPAPCTL